MKHLINTKNTKMRWVVTICMILAIGAIQVHATEYAKMFTIKSSTVVSNSSYTAYNKTITGVGGDSDTTWVITFGGNNKSVGTNSTNRSSCTLANNSKYAVSPVTSSEIAAAFVNTTAINNVSKITYVISGGKNQAGKAYLIYSAAGSSFAQMSLTNGTQGGAIPAASVDSAFEFTKCSGYFGLLFIPDNTSGDWRIDDVDITFYKELAMRSVVWKVENSPYTPASPGSSSVAVGEKVAAVPTAPSVPAACLSANAGAKFMGWTATANYTGAGAPSDLFTTATGAPEAPAGTGAITYYAVFADPVAVAP